MRALARSEVEGGLELLGRLRPAPKCRPWPELAAEREEAVELGLLLDALGDRGAAERAAEVHDRAHERGVRVLVAQRRRRRPGRS